MCGDSLTKPATVSSSPPPEPAFILPPRFHRATGLRRDRNARIRMKSPLSRVRMACVWLHLGS